MSAVTEPVATALVNEYLRGLPGDPQITEAYDRLIAAVSALAVSVDHARSALECFQENFPSPRELKDTLYNLTARFQEPERTPARDFSQDPESNGAEFRDQVVRTLRGDFAGSLEELKISAVRNMLYYTEGPGKSEPHDRKYWEQEVHHTLRDFPGLVAAVREGRSPTAEELNPHTAPRPIRGTPSPIESPAVTEKDLEAARQRYEEQKEQLRNETKRYQEMNEIDDVNVETSCGWFPREGEDW